MIQMDVLVSVDLREGESGAEVLRDIQRMLGVDPRTRDRHPNAVATRIGAPR